MRRFLTFFTFLFLSTLAVKAHEKITFQTKESFHQACEPSKFCSSFDLIKLENKKDLSEAAKYARENPGILSYTLEGNIVNLQVLTARPEKVIYQKLFYLMGLNEIEILEGKFKGVYTVEAFLDLYNF